MRIFLFILFVSFHGTCFCQDTIAVHGRDSLGIHDTVVTRTMLQKLQGNVPLKKIMKIFSYLNYCDVRMDRPEADSKVFECYRGKRIRRLEVEVVYPYGVNLDSPSVYHPTRPQALANKLQFHTRDQVIKNEVLFKEGDPVDPALFADTERNLWEKNIYKDIRIMIEEIGDDMVDVTIYVRDRWNIGLLTSAGYNNVQVGLQFNNIFGLSQSAQVDATFFFRTFAAYRVHVGYGYSNIRRSFVNIAFNGTYDILDQAGSININRAFFSAKTEWAGRVLLNVSRNNLVLPDEQLRPFSAWVSTVAQDYWLARSFKLGGNLGAKYPLARIIVSTRMQRTDYMSRPYTAGANHIINFIDQDNLLGGVGLAHWDFYIDHNVYNLEKAEYFPKGISAELIGGFQNDEILRRRTYLAVAMQYGISFDKAGYFLTFLKAGSFINPNSLTQGLINWENTFYTIATKMHSWSMRSFINTNVKLGYSRPLGQEILVNNNNGLRGLGSLYMRGVRSYALSYEADFYYSKKILGFSTSYFVFSDLSMLERSAQIRSFQSGVGLGVRLRNLNFGIGFIEVTLVYYPKLNVPDQQQYSVLGNVISNRTPVKKDLFTPDLLNVD